MNFKDKIVWITGASSGIGEALAYAFAAQEAKLVLSARRLEELERVKKNCKLPSDNVFILPMDLTKHELMQELTDKVMAKFGKIDILINNGGISQRGLAKDTLFEVDKEIMNINYFGAVALTKAVLPIMLAQKSGHIGVLSSVTGKVGVPMRSAYAASKHALFGFFDTLRAEVWRDNINVTIFCPGYIKTNISIHALKGDGKPQNAMDSNQENGMLPDYLAKKMLQAIASNKEEVYIGGKEVIGIYLRRFFPKLFSKIVRKRVGN